MRPANWTSKLDKIERFISIFFCFKVVARNGPKRKTKCIGLGNVSAISFHKRKTKTINKIQTHTHACIQTTHWPRCKSRHISINRISSHLFNRYKKIYTQNTTKTRTTLSGDRQIDISRQESYHIYRAYIQNEKSNDNANHCKYLYEKKKTILVTKQTHTNTYTQDSMSHVPKRIFHNDGTEKAACIQSASNEFIF